MIVSRGRVFLACLDIYLSERHSVNAGFGEQLFCRKDKLPASVFPAPVIFGRASIRRTNIAMRTESFLGIFLGVVLMNNKGYGVMLLYHRF